MFGSEIISEPFLFIQITFNVVSMLAQTANLGCSKRVSEEKLSLFNILTCLICSAKAKSAHFCPNCSKFYCEDCIKGWILKGNNYCLNCKCNINENSIVNCSKLSQDLSNALQALIQLEAPQQYCCEQHNIPQTYYCHDCVNSLCSDCIVIEATHRGHNVCKLNKVKMEFNEQILMHLSKIRKNVKQIEKTKEEMSLSRNKQNEILKNKIENLNMYMQKVKQNYEQLINQTTQKFQDNFSKNKLTHISRNKMYEQLLTDIKEMSKINLVRKTKQEIQLTLYNQINQANKNFITKYDILNCLHRDQIQNAISSKFAHQIFIISNYTQKREKRQVIYSQSFKNGPLEWRLKIYPNGLQKKREGLGLVRQKSTHSNFTEQYISIYIQLVSGVREGGRYSFSIEIVNPNDENKVISQVYEADFDIGKCWGYDQFANISTLYQKGYVLPQEDSLKISVCVGPPSYYFSTLDQQAMIANKEKVIIANQIKIQDMRNKIQSLKINKSQSALNSEKQKTVQNIKIPSLSSIHSQPLLAQKQNIRTPRPYEAESKTNDPQQQNMEQTIDFQKYVVELPGQDESRCNQQFDHQSAELRKIYRRFTNLNERSNLLLF